MPESEDPKDPGKVSNNDLRNSQFAGGFIDAQNVNAGRIGGDIRNTVNFSFGQRASNELLNPKTRNHIRQILLKQVSTEVESRISTSLHNRIYIVQDTDQNPSEIELPWASEIKVGSTPKIHLTNTEIIAIYDQPDIAGRLLILGNPGVGKTTMLLKLAEELVKRAKNDSTHPIPVLFTLSSWKKDSNSIKDWLVDQLKEKYGVRKDIGKQLVENQEILPLLDGLDELAAEHQEKCVVKINDFINSGWSNSLVICSRIQEYQRYKTLLQLNNSLELCLFTQEQVNQYLQNTDNLQLCDSINQDEELSKLAKTPLLLNIIVHSAQELSIETWQRLKSSEERLNYLFETYVSRMLKRKYRNKKPDLEKTKHWLSWLAQRLNEQNVNEFFLDVIQPTWLSKANLKFVYFIIVNLFLLKLYPGVMKGLFIAINLRVKSEVNLEMISTIISTVSSEIISYFDINTIILIPFFGIVSQIETVNARKFSLKNFLFFLIVGLISGFTSLNTEELILVITLVLNFGLITVINRQPIENKTIPNQGIRLLVNDTIIILTSSAFLVTLIVIIVTKKFQPLQDLTFSAVFGLLFGLLVAMPEKLTPLIQHFVLRVILWANGYAPWNYAKFLDYCTNRLFLQRVGGGYRFMHDLLRQHFADYSVPRNLAPIQETTVATSVLIPDYISCTSCGHHNSTNCKFCTQCGMGLNKLDI